MKPGTIVLSKIDGITGKLVWLGQAINGDLSEWTHVGIVVPGRAVFEAQPGGAVIAPMAGRTWAEVDVKLTDAQRDRIVRECHRRVGTGYNWTTYFYLAAYRLRLPGMTQMLRRRVANSDKLICSQAVDDIYRTCGITLFRDGRLPYDVTPGDFARLLPKD